ncbi:junctional adhesion molecule-like [Colossoma macropomum]|uniref:junctional adhesion molecule-like n=1 Tax=Colossoma macropomum TaxID=42526 RepID=UPI0018643EBF|nr:junctional adhesion molecule-like [Colossoma macropomum]
MEGPPRGCSLENLGKAMNITADAGGTETTADGEHRIQREEERAGDTGCILENTDTTSHITTHTGGSALLPCYCTDRHAALQRFTWTKLNKNTNTWEEISSESGQYRNRVQLVNGHSPGNLSLLISHLTEEDGGVYHCNADKSGYLYIRLYVKVCSLENSGIPLSISAHTGGSVLLPCYCTDQHTKPERFTWEKLNITSASWEEISSESGQYRNRVQLVNGHSPGNLSLLISHLTEEDGGWYKCDLGGSEHIVLKLTVIGKILLTYYLKFLPFVPFALVTVIFLHIIVAVVYHTKRNKDPARVLYSTADGDGVVSLDLRLGPDESCESQREGKLHPPRAASDRERKTIATRDKKAPMLLTPYHHQLALIKAA